LPRNPLLAMSAASNGAAHAAPTEELRMPHTGAAGLRPNHDP